MLVNIVITIDIEQVIIEIYSRLRKISLPALKLPLKTLNIMVGISK
jgi:hypothetical protein